MLVTAETPVHTQDGPLNINFKKYYSMDRVVDGLLCHMWRSEDSSVVLSFYLCGSWGLNSGHQAFAAILPAPGYPILKSSLILCNQSRDSEGWSGAVTYKWPRDLCGVLGTLTGKGLGSPQWLLTSTSSCTANGRPHLPRSQASQELENAA